MRPFGDEVNDSSESCDNRDGGGIIAAGDEDGKTALAGRLTGVWVTCNR